MEWKDLEKDEEPENGDVVLIFVPWVRNPKTRVVRVYRYSLREYLSPIRFIEYENTDGFEMEYTEADDDVRYWLPISDLL